MRLQDIEWGKVKPKVGLTANPVAGGSPALVTVPAGKAWLIVSMDTLGNTDGNAADRYPWLRVDDGVNIVNAYISPTPITASITGIHATFAAGAVAASYVADGGSVVTGYGTPGVEMIAAERFRLQLLNMQVGDDFGPLYYKFKEVQL